jgi:predicted branched-subunit amino acid permease
MSDSRAGSSWFLSGLAGALALPAWVVMLSLMGVGSLARDVGHPVGAAVASTLLIWAGPAQVIYFGGIAAGTPLPAIAAAVCLSSIRFLPMTIALMPLLRRPGQRLGLQLFAAHFIAVTVWSESLRRLPGLPEAGRLPYYFGFAAGCIGVSALGTAAGYVLVGAVPGPLAAALLFMTPVFFTMSIAAGARYAGDWLALGLGFGLEPVARVLVGPEFDLLAAGLVGGTIAYFAGPRMGRRP